jgi:RadC-like JAB domain-containing protein
MTGPVSVRAFCPATCCGHISALPCLESTGNFFPLAPEQYRLGLKFNVVPCRLDVSYAALSGIRRCGFRFVHPICTRAFGCSAQPRAGGRNIFAPAVTQLLMLRCPAARAQTGAFRQERGCSLRAVKRAVPLLRNETQNMNTTENLISTGCPATDPQPTNQVIKPMKFPAQPQEWKIISLRECPTPENLQHCETPDQAAAYWKTHIASHPYFNSECECLVVFILNTRRRVKGHYLVSIGTMDTILCHPREVFRLAIMASAAAIIVAHNHPSGESTPSEADIKITRDLIRAGQLLKIEVLDHIVIGNPNHSSLRSLGYFFS